MRRAAPHERSRLGDDLFELLGDVLLHLGDGLVEHIGLAAFAGRSPAEVRFGSAFSMAASCHGAVAGGKNTRMLEQ